MYVSQQTWYFVDELSKEPTIVPQKLSPLANVSKGRGSRPDKLTKQHDVGDAEQRMQDIVRAQGRLSSVEEGRQDS
jgi:ATP-dependent RNA helicase DDX31/DBP7